MTTTNKVLTGISLLYIVGLCAYMILHRIWFSPDQFFVFALIGVMLLGRARAFIMDWGPFLFLFIGYEFLRGLVPEVSKNVHIFPMINLDKFFFGFIPTVKAQTLLYTPPNLHWYDYVLVTLYICHFVTPMIVGFVFWLQDRAFFKTYTLGLLLLSYTAFFTFMLFPAMPPWMASNQGYIPPIREVTGVVMSHFMPPGVSLPSLYEFMRPNPVAAMPSLHAAFPLLVFLFLHKKFGKKALVFLPYVLGVWFAVVYLGEHYVTDVTFGAMYAITAFLLVTNKERLWRGLKVRLARARAAATV